MRKSIETVLSTTVTMIFIGALYFVFVYFYQKFPSEIDNFFDCWLPRLPFISLMVFVVAVVVLFLWVFLSGPVAVQKILRGKKISEFNDPESVFISSCTSVEVFIEMDLFQKAKKVYEKLVEYKPDARAIKELEKKFPLLTRSDI